MKKIKWYIQILIAIIGLAGAIFSFIRFNNGNDINEVMFGLIFLVFFAIIFVIFAFKALFNSPKAVEGAKDNLCVLFYTECKKNHINSPDDFDSNIMNKRAEAIMHNWHTDNFNYIKELGFKTAFVKGKAEAAARDEKHNAAQKKKEEKEAIEKLQKKMKVTNASDKYIPYYGRDKTRNMLSDMILVEKGSTYHAYEFNQGVKAVGKELKEPVVEWGWMGGIADGIAGGAAGLAAASATESRNAQARAHNAEVEKDVLTATRDGWYEAVKKDEQHRKNAEKYSDYLNKLPRAIILNEDTEAIFKEIDVCINKLTKHRHGNYMSLAVSFTGKYLREEGVKFVMDGVIKAHLVQNGTTIGSAYFVLPWNGLSSKQISMTRMILCSEEPSKDVEIKFEPYRLWIIESLESMK